MYLTGDIGGTKTLLALTDAADGRARCLYKQRFASSGYPTFAELLGAFIEAARRPAITACCIGVAGPVIDGKCETTNLPWHLDGKSIAERLNAPDVWLLNDLEAIAWGLPGLADADLVELNPEARAQSGLKAVIAPGTGLGEALMPYIGKKYHVLASEGGHADFAPADARQIELLRYLLEKYPGHVSYERLLSGDGLVNIYRFLKTAGAAEIRAETEEAMRAGDPAAAISTAAMTAKDPLCVEALALFCRICGAEAGNLALKTLAYGGLYIAGGIAPKILPFLRQGEFLQGFLEKGRYRTLLNTISVKVCINPEVGLLGALHFIRQQLPDA